MLKTDITRFTIVD